MGMLKWLIRRRLAAFERAHSYDTSYMREVLDTDFGAFLKIAKIAGALNWRRDAPLDLYYAVKLTGVIAEDCGPCSQLVIGFALADGLAPEVVASIVTNKPSTANAQLGQRFARATLAHDDADELRDQIVAAYGKRALLSCAFALTAAKFYPTLKYALGHGKACTRLEVAGQPLTLAA
jgi:hypothetical protein